MSDDDVSQRLEAAVQAAMPEGWKVNHMALVADVVELESGQRDTWVVSDDATSITQGKALMEYGAKWWEACEDAEIQALVFPGWGLDWPDD